MQESFIKSSSEEELRQRAEEIFELGFWDKQEYLNQERALEAINEELKLRGKKELD